MTLDEMKHRLAKATIDVRRAIDNDLPKIIGNRAVKMYKQNFRTESFFGQRWRDVKRRTNPPKRSKHPSDARRNILTGRTGDLGRSIKADTSRKGQVTIYSDAKSKGYYYGLAHNEGTNRIPRRQFLGDHPEIKRMVKDEIEKAIGKALGIKR